MLSINDLKNGGFIQYEGEPYQVQTTLHVKMGRGGAVLRTRIKNLISGIVLEKNFKGGDKFEDVDLQKSKASFLYKDNEGCHFMDAENYNQFSLADKNLGDQSSYLKEGQEVNVLIFNDKPVTIEIPKKVSLKVIEAAPAIRGDTAQGSVTKTAVLETGLKINVPIFINEGDTISVNTETGEYVERV